jgi:diguanylate cyclase (GGDEF)-like protein
LHDVITSNWINNKPTMRARSQSTLTLSLHAHPIAKGAGLVTTLVGLVILTGWAFHVNVTQRILPDLASMQANTALELTLLGAGLWFSTLKKYRRSLATVGRASATVAWLISAATLSDYVLGYNLGIEKFIVAGFQPGSLHTVSAGRMSLATALSVFMVATALLLLPSRSVLVRRVVQLIVLASLLIATLALVGYAYGFESVYEGGSYSSMAVDTATTLLLLCIGLLYTRADFEIMAPVRSSYMGGLLARKMLPAVLGIPLLLGWVRLGGQHFGEYGLELGVLIHTITTIVAFAALVWCTARSMNTMDSQRELARKAEREMRVLSEVDPLTGVLNRRSLHERMEREWSYATRHAKPLAAIMVDIDFFKQVNDTRGHAEGDALLKTVAQLLLEQCRPSDLVCRYGGDEFCVLMRDTTESGAATLAERLRATLSEKQLRGNGEPFTMTGSFGVAERSEDTLSVSNLIEQADQALLAAKQAGRNRIVRASNLKMCLS